MDHCPTCGAETKGARFCRMCGVPLLADVLVDTAASQAAGSRSEGAATMPVVPLPEQFESLFRPMAEPRPMDATQPMSVLPLDVAGLPPAPPSPTSVEEIDEPESRRRLFAIVGVGTALAALVVVIAVLLLGNSGTAAGGRPNTPDLTTAASASRTAPPAAVNAPAVNPTTAATSPRRSAASTKATAPKTTAKSTTTKPANTWPGNLSFGSSGPRVRQVQEALQHLHVYYGRITGNYDASTTASVAFFQSSHNVHTSQYGTVDQTTWNALMAAAG